MMTYHRVSYSPAQERPPMPQRYHVVSTQDTRSAFNSRDVAQFLSKGGQFLLPILDLIDDAESAIDDLIDAMGRATIEAVLLMSAAPVAGPKHQGKKADRDSPYTRSQAPRAALPRRRLPSPTPPLPPTHPQNSNPPGA